MNKNIAARFVIILFIGVIVLVGLFAWVYFLSQSIIRERQYTHTRCAGARLDS